MFKTFEQAKEEVEKLRLELYPNLYSPQDENGDETELSNLQTIAEDNNEMTDTNEFTEDTSEAFGSDDEIRGGEIVDEEELENEDDLNSENGDTMDEEVIYWKYLNFELWFLINIFFIKFIGVSRK